MDCRVTNEGSTRKGVEHIDEIPETSLIQAFLKADEE
jgi:hypothetical protein